MRSLWSLAAAAALAAVAVVSTAPPADAGCEAEPGYGDLRVRKVGKNFVGVGLYYPDTGQRLTQKIDVGDTAVFEARVRNDFNRAKDVYVRGFPGGSDLSVKVVSHGKDITANAIDADGKRFLKIAAGASTPVVKFKYTLLQHVPSTSAVQNHIWGYNQRRLPPCADDVTIDIKDRSPIS